MAATGFDELVWYHTKGATGDLPAAVLVGYASNGSTTTTYANVVTADILVLGLAPVKLSGVAKGTAAGQFEAGNAVG